MSVTHAVLSAPNSGSRNLTRLRILFVPWDRFPPFRPAAKSILLHELPKRGHRIDWLVQADENHPEAVTREIDSGFAFVGASDPGRGFLNRIRKHFLNLRHACRMISLVRTNQYDILQAKDNFIVAIITCAVARVWRIPFFYWLAYPRPEASLYEGRTRIGRYPLLYIIRGHIMKFFLYKVILPGADHVFVQSERMKHEIAANGIPLRKMTPVPSCVDLNKIPYREGIDSDKLIEKGDRKWIVYLGTLKRVRKLDFVIRSFSSIAAAEPDAVLIIIGKGDQDSDMQCLKDEAERLGVAHAVIFTGFLDMTDAWEYIRRADVCLSPIFPTAILDLASPTKLVEYMAMGKPVVANDHPEQSLVIDESKAGLCVPWEERPFADAVISILGDPDEAAQMGLRGRRYVERHRTNNVMGGIVESAYTSFSELAEVSGSAQKEA